MSKSTLKQVETEERSITDVYILSICWTRKHLKTDEIEAASIALISVLWHMTYQLALPKHS